MYLRWTVAICLGLGGCAVDMDVPDGFLKLEQQGQAELRALTPDGAELWVREFAVDAGATIDYWAEAVAVDLRDARGYELGEPESVTDGTGREGRAFTGATVVAGERCGYYVAVFLLPKSWLPFTQEHVRVVEFAAPRERFDADIEDVRAAVATLR